MNHEGTDLEGPPVRKGIVCTNSAPDFIASLQEHVIDASLHEAVGAGQARNSAAYNDNVMLLHHGFLRAHKRRLSPRHIIVTTDSH
jgi:hypothetical protein